MKLGRKMQVAINALAYNRSSVIFTDVKSFYNSVVLKELQYSGRLQALSTNIRLGWECLATINALA
jgi:hypothetical protein